MAQQPVDVISPEPLLAGCPLVADTVHVTASPTGCPSLTARTYRIPKRPLLRPSPTTIPSLQGPSWAGNLERMGFVDAPRLISGYLETTINYVYLERRASQTCFLCLSSFAPRASACPKGFLRVYLIDLSSTVNISQFV